MTRQAIRFAAGALAYAVLSYLLGYFGGSFLGGTVAVVALVVGTLTFGAAFNRWSAPSMPWVAMAVLIGVAYVQDPQCSDCEYTRAGSILLFTILYALPASAAIAIGVAGRRGAAALLARRRATTAR
jgi:hypothetical protein